MRDGKCYLCGSSDNITSDHIPPKCFFVPPLPDNLITVPCCEMCNNSFKKDDEAARVFLSAYRWQSEKGMWIWKNKVVASTFRRSFKLKAAFRKSMLSVPVKTAKGIEVMPVVQFPVDRLNPWFIRITKGLIFRFYPAISSSGMYFDIQQIIPSQEIADHISANMIGDERGDGVFRFWRVVMPDDINCPGIWYYVFYDGMCFAVTHSKDKAVLESIVEDCGSEL